jgi:hypothetical protein
MIERARSVAARVAPSSKAAAAQAAQDGGGGGGGDGLSHPASCAPLPAALVCHQQLLQLDRSNALTSPSKRGVHALADGREQAKRTANSKQ